MLDGGPSRTARTIERRPEYRQGSARQETPVPEAAAPVPRASGNSAERPSGSDLPRQSKWSPWRIILLVVGILLLVAAGWYVYSSTRGDDQSILSTVDSSKYQMVSLANGEFYFGKIESANEEYLSLKQVFYVKSNDETAKDGELGSADGVNLQLIKRGGEVHSPEDEMIINRDQVLFIENLKSDGRVAELIDNYQK